MQPRGLWEHEDERAISQEEIFLSLKKKEPHTHLKKKKKECFTHIFISSWADLENYRSL